MSLYHVQFDGGFRHVEAKNFGEALAIWNAAMVSEFGVGDSGWTGEDQPESMALIDEEPVLRDLETNNHGPMFEKAMKEAKP